MKLLVCVAVFSILALSQAMNVRRTDVSDNQASTADGHNNVLFFEPFEQESHKTKSNDEQCPDGSTCPTDNTCCQDTEGGYACCPLPKAVCCDDQTHCCPNGYICDVSAGTCTKGLFSRPWFAKNPSSSSKSNKVGTPCPGGEVSCPSDYTCCKLSSGTYGCCPMPQAMCCADGVHCCPSGYKCDLSAGTCNKGDDVIALFPKVPATPTHPTPKVKDVECDDGSSCPDGNTCCEDQAGSFACCPLSEAVCCSDKLHCCPNGYTCDVSSGRCTKGSDMLAWFTKLAAKPAPKLKDVQCKDGSSCPTDSTCCEDQEGGYACCPLPDAVCCADKVHCCPSGYTCDVSAGTCNKGNDIRTWLTKQAAKPNPSVKDVTCDDQSTCPDGDTCCPDGSGGYGCCPLPDAVCCADQIHCCPSGYTCDVSAGTCNLANEILTWFVKHLSKKPAPEVKDVICDDQSACPDGDTCCADGSGGYGCCPLPDAVCCSDHIHCCPSGYTCDVSAGTCNMANDILTWFVKHPVKKTAPEVKDVICDDQSACPDGDTCCPDASGGYGCCPLPDAVCCSDQIHCCPSGYTCDVSAGTCNLANDVLTWFVKGAVKKVAPKVKDVTCDDQSTCPDDNTCCEDLTGGYACCPLPDATCCSDQVHCCPSGYTCDVSAGTCSMGNNIQTWLRKQAAKSTPKVTGVTCPDQSTCPDANTCCPVGGGKYGCCPSPNAVCCSDNLHCCPEGYKCEEAAGGCYKGDVFVTWLTKELAKNN